MILQGNEPALRCDSCGAQLGLGRTSLENLRRRMPSGWLALEKGRHACSLCAAARFRPGLRRY